MSRKTIEISVLKEKANGMLALSDPEMVGERLGLATLLESALHATGNYKGFTYLPTEWDAEKECLRDGFDDSRRRYF